MFLLGSGGRQGRREEEDEEVEEGGGEGEEGVDTYCNPFRENKQRQSPMFLLGRGSRKST